MAGIAAAAAAPATGGFSLALPIGLILAQQGIGALSSLLGGNQRQQPAALPNLDRIRQSITSQGSTQAAANRAGIRQQGASRRLSAGATQSALAGASIQASRNTSQALARVEPLKLGIARFQEQRFQANRARTDDRRDNFANFAGAGIGALGKILLLNRQGLLDSPGEEDGLEDIQGDQFGSGQSFLQQPNPRPQLPPGLMEFLFQNN